MAKERMLDWRVNTGSLFEQITQNPQTEIMTRPLQIMGRILAAVAERASELNDPELHGLMCQLALYAVSDPYDKKAFRPRIADRLIKAGNKAHEVRLKNKLA